MSTWQQVVEGAYLRSSRNAPGKSASDTELLGMLGRAYAAYWRIMAEANPERFRSTLTVQLGGVPAVASIPTTVRDIAYAEDATGAEVTIIPREEALRSWHLAPAVYWIGSNLQARGQTGDPIAGAQLTLLVLLAPTAPAAVTDTIDARFPDEYLELLILEGAAYLALKDANRDPDEFKNLMTERQAARTQFVHANGGSETALAALIDDGAKG